MNTTHSLETRTLAHDLRSPLSALKLMTQDISLCRETQTIIDQSLKSLEKMIQRLSFLSTPFSLNPSLNSFSTRPYEITKRCVQNLNRRFADSEVMISAELDRKACDLTSPINELDFERALTNLLTNALEALNENDGEKMVHVKLRVKKKSLRLFIEDKGRGIPTHLISQVTQPGATFGKQKGSGYGLFQAKNAIESSGGRLLISSEEGKGTIITLDIPFIAPLHSDDLRDPAANAFEESSFFTPYLCA